MREFGGEGFDRILLRRLRLVAYSGLGGVNVLKTVTPL
jgi:hypothetical protein